MPEDNDQANRRAAEAAAYGPPGYDRLVARASVATAVRTMTQSATLAGVDGTIMGRTFAESAGIKAIMETQKAAAVAMSGINTTAMTTSLMSVAKASQMAALNDDLRKQISGITAAHTLAKSFTQSASLAKLAGINGTLTGTASFAKLAGIDGTIMGRTFAESAGIKAIMETQKAAAVAMAGINTAVLSESLMRAAKAATLAGIGDAVGRSVVESAAITSFIEGARILRDPTVLPDPTAVTTSDLTPADPIATTQEWWATLPTTERYVILVAAWLFVRVMFAATRTVLDPSATFDPLGSLSADAYVFYSNFLPAVVIAIGARRR